MNEFPENRPRAYLAGAMERSPDRGRAWRASLLPVLEELGHGWFNPCDEELVVLSQEERSSFRRWKAEGHERFQPMMQRIIDFDLAALRSSDYVVCYWDVHAQQSGGTPSEVTLARHWGKPVYLVPGMRREEVSAWVLGCATRLFDSFDELCEYLRTEYGSS